MEDVSYLRCSLVSKELEVQRLNAEVNQLKESLWKKDWRITSLQNDIKQLQLKYQELSSISNCTDSGNEPGSGINSSDLDSSLSSSTDLVDASLNGTPSQQVSFLDQDHSRAESAETRRTQFSKSRSNTLNKSFDAKLLLDKVIENVHKIVAFYESVGVPEVPRMSMEEGPQSSSTPKPASGPMLRKSFSREDRCLQEAYEKLILFKDKLNAEGIYHERTNSVVADKTLDETLEDSAQVPDHPVYLRHLSDSDIKRVEKILEPLNEVVLKRVIRKLLMEKLIFGDKHSFESWKWPGYIALGKKVFAEISHLTLQELRELSQENCCSTMNMLIHKEQLDETLPIKDLPPTERHELQERIGFLYYTEGKCWKKFSEAAGLDEETILRIESSALPALEPSSIEALMKLMRKRCVSATLGHISELLDEFEASLAAEELERLRAEIRRQLEDENIYKRQLHRTESSLPDFSNDIALILSPPQTPTTEMSQPFQFPNFPVVMAEVMDEWNMVQES